MKKILGLDLGSASIGWALIEENQQSTRIIGLGSRIIPYEGTEGKDFAKGTGESRNAERTKARTARKGYDRYQLRRRYLVDALVKSGMMPDDSLRNMDKTALWSLRSKAANDQISLNELGRILLWLNQKRGYKSSRSDANASKKDTDYVAAVKSRHQQIKEKNQTIGQYFYAELIQDPFFRVKDNIFPREAYIEEFDAIWNEQKKYYTILSNCPTEILIQIAKTIFPGDKQEFLRKEVLKNGLYHTIKNMIIYNQRPLKSQKGLVSVCEFEGFWRKAKDNKDYFVGPKVAPKSSPIFQLAKIRENINNIRLTDKKGNEISISPEQKQALFDHLDNNEKLTPTDLLKILNLKKENCVINKQLEKGIQGNTTKHAIKQQLGVSETYASLYSLELTIIEDTKPCYLYSKKTGEVLNEKTQRYIDATVEQQPFYQLWHTIYSIHDKQECSQALQRKFEIDSEIANKLADIDFSKAGFGNKSVKAIRKTLPYLMEGDKYSEAMCYGGYEHSDSLTKDENLKRKLLEQLKPIQKNALRQPIVEKILNQMVNVVNAIIEEHGKPDEIRVELARELKQSKEERNDITSVNAANEIINNEITKRLTELGLPTKKKNIEKYKYIFPIRSVINKDGKVESPKLKNAMICNQCIYCGSNFSLSDAINGDICDVDHIIPKKLLFDDSQSNKVLVHRRCNQNDKSDKTAYDFIRAKGNGELDQYLLRVDDWYKRGIVSGGKRIKLLVSHEDYLERKKQNKTTETDKKIWEDFINRQINETRYISSKSREMLQTICHNVWVTSGTVTAKLRHLWGWDDVTMNLQMPKYKKLQEETDTEFIKTEEWESDHGRNKHSKEVIIGWSKRDDHRHHAVDALTIACTKQGYIQRFNTLNAESTRDEMKQALQQHPVESKEKRSLLEKYIMSERPIPVTEVEKAVAGILISFKSGKKVAVVGKRKVGKRGSKKVVQEGIIVPRGALSEDSVYGKIKSIDKGKNIKYIFENPQLILKPNIKILVENRIAEHKGDIKKAIASVKKNPIYLDSRNENVLEYASCFKTEYVIKYTVDINFNKIEKVIDSKIKEILQNRLDKFGGKAKEAFKDVQLADKSIIKWYDDEQLTRPINTVRCFTGLSAVVPVKKDEQGNDIGYVKPGNNHHIAIYRDKDGVPQEHVCTFWHAVERKKYGIPVVIQEPAKVWDKIQMQPENTYPESFLEKLPNVQWALELSMQQNEMFVLGMEKEDILLAVENKEYQKISDRLYRVQKLAEKNYMFRHHLETQLIDDSYSQISKRYLNIRSLGALFGLKPIKVKIDRLGNISL